MRKVEISKDQLEDLLNLENDALKKSWEDLTDVVPSDVHFFRESLESLLSMKGIEVFDLHVTGESVFVFLLVDVMNDLVHGLPALIGSSKNEIPDVETAKEETQSEEDRTPKEMAEKVFDNYSKQMEEVKEIPAQDHDFSVFKDQDEDFLMQALKNLGLVVFAAEDGYDPSTFTPEEVMIELIDNAPLLAKEDKPAILGMEQGEESWELFQKLHKDLVVKEIRKRKEEIKKEKAAAPVPPSKKEKEPKQENKEAQKQKDGKPPGVISSIFEFLKDSGEDGITTEEILEKLEKRFPDRNVDGMRKTLIVMLPTRMAKEKAVHIVKDKKTGKFSIQ